MNDKRLTETLPILLLSSLLLLGVALGSASSSASSLSDEYRISQPGAGDQNYLQQQYDLAQRIIYDALLTRLSGEKEHDLNLIQKLLDGRHLQSHQRRELQALGAILGRFLEKEFRMKWVIYEDVVGRSRGLQVDSTRQVIFPLTMISRRVEVDAKADVMAIYEKAADIVRYTLKNKPLFTD